MALNCVVCRQDNTEQRCITAGTLAYAAHAHTSVHLKSVCLCLHSKVVYAYIHICIYVYQSNKDACIPIYVLCIYTCKVCRHASKFMVPHQLLQLLDLFRHDPDLAAASDARHGTEVSWIDSLSLSVSLHIYIYVYLYLYIYICR